MTTAITVMHENIRREMHSGVPGCGYFRFLCLLVIGAAAGPLLFMGIMIFFLLTLGIAESIKKRHFIILPFRIVCKRGFFMPWSFSIWTRAGREGRASPGPEDQANREMLAAKGARSY